MTNTVHWFELGREIAEFHARSTSDEITVIPVIVEDLESARPILRALAQVHEGNFFDASISSADPGVLRVQGPVPGTKDPVRRTAVETSLGTMDGRDIFLLDEDNGLLNVGFRNPEAAVESSAGDGVLASVIRAATHEELDRSAFAIIAYESGVLDRSSKKAAWDLMLNQLNDMPNATLRTLLVVVEAAINIDLHCQSGRGFRFAVERGELLRRHGSDHLRSSANQIIRQARASPIVFFLGAGFSASSRMPLGDALRDNAVRRILNIPPEEPADSLQLGIRFHAWLADQGSGWIASSEALLPSEEFAKRLTLERVTSVEHRISPSGSPTLQEFRLHHDRVIDEPGPSVLGLASILQRLTCRVILAQVNFDCLVEHNSDVDLKLFVTDDEFEEAPEYIRRYIDGNADDIPLLKLHGTINDIDTCIVSQEQTEHGVGDPKLGTLRALFEGREERLPWVYVGASMRDQDLLRVLSGEDFGRNLDERWVLPYVVPSVREFGQSREAFWKDTGLQHLQDRVITETSDAFFQVLADGWPKDENDLA